MQHTLLTKQVTPKMLSKMCCQSTTKEKLTQPQQCSNGKNKSSIMVQVCQSQFLQLLQYWGQCTLQRRDRHNCLYLSHKMNTLYNYRYMQKSDQHESSVAEEQHINIIQMKKKEEQIQRQKIKYATVNEIRAFQRSSQLHNQKFIENRALLFSQQQIASVLPIHFISSNAEQSFSLGGKKEDIKDILEVEHDKLTLKIAVSNIKRQNSFILDLKNLKKRAILQLKSIQVENQNAVKFKYRLNLSDTNLLVRVFVELDGQFKVWKEVEVPLSQNKFTFEIHEYNHQQTDIKINDFLFHLILNVPYIEKSNYCLIHEANAEIEKIELISKPQKKEIQSKETYCSKDCQLI